MSSKELLSDVLGMNIQEVDSTEAIDENLICYFKEGEDNIQNYINIHELAHQCKEWVYNNKYSMLVQKWRTLGEWVVHISGNGVKRKEFIADTEPEAIFKACEWILKDIEE